MKVGPRPDILRTNCASSGTNGHRREDAVSPRDDSLDRLAEATHNAPHDDVGVDRAMNPASDTSFRSPQPVTRLLEMASRGERQATEALLPLVYEQLRALAQQHLARERHGHTLQATALVHEAYLRLLGDEPVSWSGRGHFYAAAAEAMRRILIDHARRRGAVKRGRDWTKGAARLADLTREEHLGELLALDEAMSRLSAAEARAAEVVKLRFFAGMSVDQIAHVMDIAPRTVDRLWMFAKAWLLNDLQGQGRDESTTGVQS